VVLVGPGGRASDGCRHMLENGARDAYAWFVSNRWTEDEIRILMTACYLPVLQAEISGEQPVKADYLRAAQRQLSDRTLHTVQDRCYRISEVLRDEGLPWVFGWKPPDMVGQTPNSPGVTILLRKVVLPMMSAAGVTKGTRFIGKLHSS
jgi:hypothetical protein